MRRFAWLEDLGLSVAAMSEMSDGDCKLPEQRERACATLGIDSERLGLVKQVHGQQVLRAQPSDSSKAARRVGDGLYTRGADSAIGVFVADCVPVFLFDPVQRAMAIVHAGRVGTELGVSSNAVRRLENHLDVDAANLYALVGPSAGPCCYEVSTEMAASFEGLGYSARGRHLDLWDANVRQLEGAGVPRAQIHIEGICTICDERFHSHRRNGDGGRNIALMVL